MADSDRFADQAWALAHVGSWDEDSDPLIQVHSSGLPVDLESLQDFFRKWSKYKQSSGCGDWGPLSALDWSIPKLLQHTKSRSHKDSNETEELYYEYYRRMFYNSKHMRISDAGADSAPSDCPEASFSKSTLSEPSTTDRLGVNKIGFTDAETARENLRPVESPLVEVLRLLNRDGILTDAFQAAQFIRWLDQVTADIKDRYPDHPLVSGFNQVLHHLQFAIGRNSDGIVSRIPGEGQVSGSLPDSSGNHLQGTSQNSFASGNLPSTGQSSSGEGSKNLVSSALPYSNTPVDGKTIACPIQKFIFHHGDLEPQWHCTGLHGAKQPSDIEKHLFRIHREGLNISKDLKHLTCRDCWGWYFSEEEKSLRHGQGLCRPVNLPKGEDGKQRRFDKVFLRIFPGAIWLPSAFNEETHAWRRPSVATALPTTTTPPDALTTDILPVPAVNEQPFLGHDPVTGSNEQAYEHAVYTPPWSAQGNEAMRLLNEALHRFTGPDFFSNLIFASDYILGIAAREQERNRSSQSTDNDQLYPNPLVDSGYVTQASSSLSSQSMLNTEQSRRRPSLNAGVPIGSQDSPSTETLLRTPQACEHNLDSTGMRGLPNVAQSGPNVKDSSIFVKPTDVWTEKYSPVITEVSGTSSSQVNSMFQSGELLDHD